jgi:hypothetical protein
MDAIYSSETSVDFAGIMPHQTEFFSMGEDKVKDIPGLY